MHYSLLVRVPARAINPQLHTSVRQQIEAHLAVMMGLYQDRWGEYSIGGRWSGALQGYAPAEDKDNYQQCYACQGTGTREGYVFNDILPDQPTPAGHPVIGAGCSYCRGTGWELKSPDQLKQIGNYQQISLLDWQIIHDRAEAALNAFWQDWQDFAGGKTFGLLESPRVRAMAFGLIDCRHTSELTGEEWKVIRWDNRERDENDEQDLCDVLKPATRAWLLFNYLHQFNALYTKARLSEEGGWEECDDRGEWIKNTQQFADGLPRWLTAGNQDDWLVIVDCHL